MSSTLQRLAPAASGIAQYLAGFAMGSVLGTATYFYVNRETVVVGEEGAGLPMRFRWASGADQMHAQKTAAHEPHHH